MTEKKAMLISELAENDQNAAKQQIQMMLKWLAICECYLRDYAEGTQTIFKMLQVVKETRLLTIVTIGDLCNRHKLSHDFKEMLTEKNDPDFIAAATTAHQQLSS
jgi:hypothetical protein